MIVQKRDFRKRKGRNVFFLLQAIPFFVLAVLVVFMINNADIKNNQNSIVSRYLQVPGTGQVINTLGLTQTEFNSTDLLTGTLNIALSPGDFLPLNTNFSFRFSSQYPIDYVCQDGSVYTWRDIEGQYVDPSPIELCGDAEITHYNCNDSAYDKDCCAYGVNGAVYGNLDCPTGKTCGESCLAPSVNTLQELIGQSTTPDKGNYTNSVYKNNSQQIPGITPASGPGVGYCFDNKSVPQPTPQNFSTCQDTDGINSSYKGTCIDSFGNNLSDACSIVGNSVDERYCAIGSLILKYNCSACTIPTCRHAPTEAEGWYSDCAGVETLIKYVGCYYSGQDLVPVCTGSEPLGNKGWYDPYACKSQTLSCPTGCFGSEGVCSGSASPSNPNCSGWNNDYSIPFERLGIRAPSESGKYGLEILSSWGITNFSLFTTYFNVAESHKVCVNNACVYVNGPGDNECDNSDECGCEPDWTYGSWSGCVDGYMYRNKVDSNNCSSVKIESKPCQGCVPSWLCMWQQCSAGSVQQKICTDAMSCNPLNVSYLGDSRVCCVEKWKGTTGSCVDNARTVTYQDLNNCGTEFSKPLSEIKSCGFLSTIFEKWYFWVIFVVFVSAVVFIVLFFTVFHKSRGEYYEPLDEGTGSLETGNSLTRREASYLSSSRTRPRVEEELKEPEHLSRARRPTSPRKEEIKTRLERRVSAKTSEKVETRTEATLSKYPSELVSYIRSAIDAGASKEEVKMNLLEVGWKEDIIDGILEEL